ncbi:acetate/propionate family kinase [Kribbella capetownensis]|uniref:Acetate kinase n=1 Tax=Kribbella capetownensis TaxID=1572659 RepID=A0A4R0JKD3_9ACTN|nr:acetate/propionate family kinase [Kribbella capetownensis]TCC47541.1 acetate/propionate family kinase [Kribbella capetownensis]
MDLLIVNAGSSSLKLRVLSPDDEVLDERSVTDWSGSADALSELRADAVVHRVVHGGSRFDGAVLVDDDVEAAIEELVPLAPLHQPRALELIRASRRDDRPVVACFDTSYHRTIPAAAATYALPGEWRDRFGLRKFGFHGLSHEYVARTVEAPRVVSCHLGAGASLCAIEDGASVDTTMGFTPVDGLVMATRSGSVDPGLLMWLQTAGGLMADDLADALEHRSGLLGLTGKTEDLQEILAGLDDDTYRLAYDVYLHRLAGEITRMAAALGGLDALVFTGGVGERSAAVRAATCTRLTWLGVTIDRAANEAGASVITTSASPVTAYVVPAREDLTMAAQARRLLTRAPGRSGSR